MNCFQLMVKEKNNIRRTMVTLVLMCLALALCFGCSGEKKTPPPVTKAPVTSTPQPPASKIVPSVAVVENKTAGETAAEVSVAGSTTETVRPVEPKVPEVPSMTTQLASSIEEQKKMYLPSSFILYKSTRNNEVTPSAQTGLLDKIEQEAIAAVLSADASFTGKISANQQRLAVEDLRQQIGRLKFDPSQEEIIQFKKNMNVTPDGSSGGQITMKEASFIRDNIINARWEMLIWKEFKELLDKGQIVRTAAFQKIASLENPFSKNASMNPDEIMAQVKDPKLGSDITFSECQSYLQRDGGRLFEGPLSPEKAIPQTEQAASGFGGEGMMKNVKFADIILQQVVGARIIQREAATYKLKPSKLYSETKATQILNEYFMENPIKHIKPEEISDQDLLTYYSENLSKYTPEQAVWLNWLVFESVEEAEEVYKRLEKGETFASLIEEKTGIKDIMNENPALNDLRSELREVIEGLMPGQYSRIIGIDGKFVIVYFIHIEKKPPFSFEIVRETVRGDLIQAKELENRKKILADLKRRALESMRKQ
ncbi:MAG: hypothetical protein CVV64_08650 [Candidatus Wallbacteria bacterium HGW-Wallbacteria-1]|uniref:peptidylprolyl isomerase n=1 Tax=Candidatus Wallbacteria bacterium HGW-Wallbacteria-1 TaxID=2013854 RepID=A0A2N1PQ20_9BACT|nr:MAG: hypothetical protein CVV64_08650 [Candidatus Wallbacteria bacterium HGW-Wallbacteria-1]